TWNCCRWMVSTPRFFRLFSVYSTIYSAGNTSLGSMPLREGHCLFLGGILVATCSSLPGCRCNVLFRISSLSPSPYAQAVSKKLHPSSLALSIACFTSFSSEPVHPAIPHLP